MASKGQPRYLSGAIGLFPVVVVALVASGCTTFAAAAYVLKGTNADADFEGLRGQRVAVVCRPVSELQYSRSNVARELAAAVSRRLSENSRRVEVVDFQDVEQYIDENDWNEFTEVGHGVDADVVVGIDLEAFDLYDGQTLYRGRANVSLTVVDVATGEIAYEKIVPEVVYPPNVGKPTSEIQESAFRREFMTDLSDLVGRHFYAHDTRVDFAKDAGAWQIK